jgi:PTS system N-acetylgalactosamine-specific IIA component
MSNGARPPAIVVAHGELASGLVSAVEQITGMGDLFLARSNAGMSAADIQDMLRELVRTTGAKVIFTDLPAGSCNMAAVRISGVDDLTVVTGVNLPMLLHFALHGNLEPRAAATQSVERAITAMKVLERPAR